MGKKMKGGRRQILQLEEKKAQKSPTKPKLKTLIHYSDSDEDSKKSNDSEAPSVSIDNDSKNATPLDSQVADFFKEINALVVPDEPLIDTKSEAHALEDVPKKTATTVVDNTESVANAGISIQETSEEPSVACVWQEICDESTGYNYYWNMQTNKVTWDRPDGYVAPGDVSKSTEETIPLSKYGAEESRKKDRKKDISLPEGAIIPISYYGASSSNESSDSDSDSKKYSSKLSQKKRKVEKRKVSKKVKSKAKTEKTRNEIIGPQLPPDFQFPPMEEEKSGKTDELRKQEASATDKTSSKSPALNSSSCDTSPQEATKTAEAPKANISPDTTSISSDGPEQKITTFGLRSVVDYDSFSDDGEAEDPCPVSPPTIDTAETPESSKFSSETASEGQKERATEEIPVLDVLKELEEEVRSLKKKAEEQVNETEEIPSLDILEELEEKARSVQEKADLWTKETKEVSPLDLLKELDEEVISSKKKTGAQVTETEEIPALDLLKELDGEVISLKKKAATQVTETEEIPALDLQKELDENAVSLKKKAAAQVTETEEIPGLDLLKELDEEAISLRKKAVAQVAKPEEVSALDMLKELDEEAISLKKKDVARVTETEDNPTLKLLKELEEDHFLKKESDILGKETTEVFVPSVLKACNEEPRSLKRKAEVRVKNDAIRKEVLVKRPKRTKNVDIDGIFASHSSQGSFGFGWQRNLNEDFEVDASSSETRDYKSRKGKFKNISFVKSDNILDLKELNDASVSEPFCSSDADEKHLNSEEKNSLSSLENVAKVVDASGLLKKESDSIENATLADVDSLEDGEITAEEEKENLDSKDVDDTSLTKDEPTNNAAHKEQVEEKASNTVEELEWDMEGDIDEIDRVLSEALEAKKALKNKELKSSQKTESDTQEYFASRGTKSNIDRDSSATNALHLEFEENLSEKYTEFVDKLDLLLSNQSPPAPVTLYLIQLKTRYHDWKVGALDTKYFLERMKEAEACILHFESNLVSEDWQCQWDRVTKRYSYINRRTHLAQWTHPDEGKYSDRSSWLSSGQFPETTKHTSNPDHFEPVETQKAEKILQYKKRRSKSSVKGNYREAAKSCQSPVRVELPATTLLSEIQKSTRPATYISTSLDLSRMSKNVHRISQSTPPPPGVESPSPPPPPGMEPPSPPGLELTPPPPPSIYSTDGEREVEDMDIGNSSSDSSSFLVVQNKHVPGQSQMHYLSSINPSASFMSNVTEPPSFSHFDMHSLQWHQTVSNPPFLGQMNTQSFATRVDSSNEAASDARDLQLSLGPSNEKASRLEANVPKTSSTTQKKSKKKTKINAGLGLKKKNLPQLVQKWQKIKKQQEREDKVLLVEAKTSLLHCDQV